jgi:hypothetical protein
MGSEKKLIKRISVRRTYSLILIVQIIIIIIIIIRVFYIFPELTI